MNEKIKEFINGLGALTELWLMTYNLFIQQGCSHIMATKHTQAFIATILSLGMDNNASGAGI